MPECRNSHVNVCFFPDIGFALLLDHVAFYYPAVMGNLSLELIILNTRINID